VTISGEHYWSTRWRMVALLVILVLNVRCRAAHLVRVVSRTSSVGRRSCRCSDCCSARPPELRPVDDSPTSPRRDRFSSDGRGWRGVRALRFRHTRRGYRTLAIQLWVLSISEAYCQVRNKSDQKVPEEMGSLIGRQTVTTFIAEEESCCGANTCGCKERETATIRSLAWNTPKLIEHQTGRRTGGSMGERASNGKRVRKVLPNAFATDAPANMRPHPHNVSCMSQMYQMSGRLDRDDIDQQRRHRWAQPEYPDTDGGC